MDARLSVMYGFPRMRQVKKMATKSRLVLIALGSNENSIWGDAKETVQKAMNLLIAWSEEPANQSRLYKSPAFPEGAGPDYVNAAMAFESPCDPAQILAKLHDIEGQAARRRDVRWGQRTLDLDLVAVADCVLPDAATQTLWRDLPPERQQQIAPDTLVLPHPRVQDRSFVLVPLMDVAADWRHPILGRTTAQMLATRPETERAPVVPC
ncbi:2-amino-4-hydroxy-6-hydroxymethyldihydropteridine diphosphokinase [Yoonia sp. SS1-5]|uniref:2-amino-4-hydroxy-6-hydroxymethyldihydropteridine pyrophosphokinase n=1 Tax=Yoonia rhodophyticola TaxID=3137370 RepID=A0AAN0MBF3_9RHOB